AGASDAWMETLDLNGVLKRYERKDQKTVRDILTGMGFERGLVYGWEEKRGISVSFKLFQFHDAPGAADWCDADQRSLGTMIESSEELVGYPGGRLQTFTSVAKEHAIAVG